MTLLFGSKQLTIHAVNECNKAALLSLTTKPYQQGFIESIPDCLAEAKADPRFVPVELHWQARLVGFAMFGEFDENNTGQRIWFDRFLLDAHYQGQGLGLKFAQLMLEYLYQRYACSQVYLSVVDDNKHAINLYQYLGFVFNGEIEANAERVMCHAR